MPAVVLFGSIPPCAPAPPPPAPGDAPVKPNALPPLKPWEPMPPAIVAPPRGAPAPPPEPPLDPAPVAWIGAPPPPPLALTMELRAEFKPCAPTADVLADVFPAPPEPTLMVVEPARIWMPPP